MDSIGLDLHKRESQLCTITTDGELREQRIVTSRERFTAVLGARSPARILLEASTESEWVARHLESLGHTVIVADPGFAAMYATRSKRVKTDKRDARTLCEALQLGAYRAVHRASDAQQHLRAQLAVRDALVRTRTRYIALIKAAVRREGLRLPSGEAEQTVAKLAMLPLPAHVHASLAPLVAVWGPLQAEIAAADARLTTLARQHPVVVRLSTMPSIGPVTALAFVAALDDVARFHSAHQVQAYLGLVPSEYSSGDRRARAHHEARRCTSALAPGRGGVACPAFVEPGACVPQGVGAADRRAPRQAHRHGRAGAAHRGDPLRDVARRRAVSHAGDARPERRLTTRHDGPPACRRSEHD